MGTSTQTKHVFVTGGVVSSLGKGLTASSLGSLLVARGLLLAGGLYAFSAAPEGANAGTALIFTAVPAALMLACALMAMAIRRKKVVGMVGIHAGLALPLLFTIAYAGRAWGIDDPDKFYLRNTLWFLAVVSLVAFGAILAMRPRKSERVAPQAG